MSPLTLAVLSLGAVAGLAILGVAIWMMRTETQPKVTAPQTGSTAPVVDAAPIANAAPVMDADPAPPPETASPASPSQVLEYPQVVSPPPPISMPTATVLPEQTPDWLSSLAPNEHPAAPAPSAAATNSEELIRLWRAPGGELIVEIDGRRYPSRYDIADEAVTRRIMNALGDLNYFVNSKTPAPVQATPAPAPTAAPADELPPAKPATEERPVVVISREEAAKQPLTVPSMDIMTQFRYLRAQGKKPQVKIKSVMEEIDEILQAKIAGTPLAKRGVKITETIHGASFWLDGRSYEAVDEIPDAEARAAVQAAIQEWDKKR